MLKRDMRAQGAQLSLGWPLLQKVLNNFRKHLVNLPCKLSPEGLKALGLVIDVLREPVELSRWVGFILLNIYSLLRKIVSLAGHWIYLLYKLWTSKNVLLYTSEHSIRHISDSVSNLPRLQKFGPLREQFHCHNGSPMVLPSIIRLI